MNRLKVQFKALERKNEKTLLELQHLKENFGMISMLPIQANQQPGQNSARSASANPTKANKLRLTEAQFKAIIENCKMIYKKR